MENSANRYIREVLHHIEPPPPIEARFFYTSPLAIDDPLSPVPPPATASASTAGKPPRPFSEYDNTALDKAWHELRRKILQYHEERGEKSHSVTAPGKDLDSERTKGKRAVNELSSYPVTRPRGASLDVGLGDRPGSRQGRGEGIYSSSSGSNRNVDKIPGGSSLRTSLDALDASTLQPEPDVPATTGTPFIRAPSRKDVRAEGSQRATSRPRPEPHALDSYEWDDSAAHPQANSHPISAAAQKASKGPSTTVPVGVSRLHSVSMPDMLMQPIYWAPMNDVAPVMRGTWFYKDTMLPIETPVANMLEVGYTELQAWTSTWQDELDSACSIGAIGEEKIVRMLWPEPNRPRSQPDSRPSTVRGEVTNMISEGFVDAAEETVEKRQERELEAACDIIDVTSGAGGSDNKAAGTVNYGRYGPPRTYSQSGAIYLNAQEAVILKPSLLPSDYYGRRPLANYLRKNRKIGIPVVRGFDQKEWDKLYPVKIGTKTAKAYEGVSASQAGNKRQGQDPELAQSDRPVVTDLVFVIHGIGQKLSERVESYHFTHAMNSFRREINVELGTDVVKSQLDQDTGGIMVLPVNWRQNLSFEEGGYRDEERDTNDNNFTLKDITPDTLPSVRNIVSDVMLDIPYYLSHHQPKMVAAVIREANRIYKLWCANNPGFSSYGRVHMIAHSLGSVMALDVLSSQPTTVPSALSDPTTIDLDTAKIPHLLFNTNNLFCAGSPAGFFLLLKKATLRPRIDSPKASDSNNTPSISGRQGDYGCLAVRNMYNVINPYDPVSYRMNAAVDARYASSLKPAWLPPATSSWLSSTTSSWFGRSKEGLVLASTSALPAALPRLPSNVELETHNFTREELAEKRMLALNDNGQIDYLLRYGGGPLEIQYLTMLGAHSSYWLHRDFVRMVVVEIGRRKGRAGVLNAMRAQKRKVMLA